MACCLTASSHNLSQCWPRLIPPHAVTRSQWVKYCFQSGTTAWLYGLNRLHFHNQGGTNNITLTDGYIHSYKGLYAIGFKPQSFPLPPRLDDYYKITFVRHPLERLRSAYVDKIRGGSETFSDLVRKIANFNRGPGTHNITAKPVTFSEFVSWLIHTFRERVEIMDIHWEPMYSCCHPCDIDYDFIGHQETFEADVSYVLRNVIQTNLTFVQLFEMKRDKLFIDRIRTSEEVARDTSYKQLSNKTLQQLVSTLKDDFRLFGYLPDITKLPWYFIYGSHCYKYISVFKSTSRKSIEAMVVTGVIFRYTLSSGIRF